MTITLYTILVFSIMCAAAGVLLLRVGLRGRLVSPNLHCRKCKFDLIGLCFSDPAPCPECGTTLKVNTSAITVGYRKVRKIVLFVSILFLLTSATGLAWPKLSKLPSIQNINVYDYFPEALLLKLGSGGDQEALQMLHSRLIPGTLSEKGLQKFIDHALAMQADETVPWDERWGDVLTYAALERKLSDQQLKDLAEQSMQIVIETRHEHPASESLIRFRLGLRGDERFGAQLISRGSPVQSRFQSRWERATGKKSPYTIRYEIGDPFSHPEPPRVRVGGSGSFRWAPAWGQWFNHLTTSSVRFESEIILLEAKMKLKLSVDGREIHAWTTTASETVVRSDKLIVYAVPANDEEILDKLISDLGVGFIQVPVEIEKGRVHHGANDCQWARSIHMTTMNERLPTGVALLMDASLRVDGREIPFADLVCDNLNRTRLERGKQEEKNMLDYFQRYSSFWVIAIDRGYVDLILRPNPDLALRDPRLLQYVDKAIIFRKVPLMILEARETERVDKKTGMLWWGWEQQDRRSYTTVTGEVFEEPD